MKWIGIVLVNLFLSTSLIAAPKPSQPVGKSESEPVSKPTSQPVGKSESQPVSKPITPVGVKDTSQPVSQPIAPVGVKDTSKPPSQQITPVGVADTFPKIQNQRASNTFTTAEFIYWEYYSTNLDYGRNAVGFANASGTPEIDVPNKGKSFYPDFIWSPGFRVGMGVECGPKKAFDVYARYTWFETGPKGRMSPGDVSASFVPHTWSVNNGETTSTYQGASIDLEMHLHLAELQAGYTFDITRYLTLRPFVALNSFIVSGDLRVQYNLTTVSGVREITKYHGTSFAWNLGPSVGLDFWLHPWKYFGFFFMIDSIQLVGPEHLRATCTQEQPATSSFLTLLNAFDDPIRISDVTIFEAGPTLDMWFKDRRYHFQLRATWQTFEMNGGMLAFLTENNLDSGTGGEVHGVNVRALFEF